MKQRTPRRLKVPRAWRSEMLTLPPGWSAAGMGVVSSHGDRAGEILKGATYSTLFAYLFRRFGPPESGCDGHKELANYWMTTPVRGIGFGLNCSPCFPPCGVFYALSPEWIRKIEEWERGDFERWMHGLANHCLCEDRWLLHEAVAFANGRLMHNSIANGASPVFQRQVLRLVRDYTDRAGPAPRVRHPDEGRYGERVPVESMAPSPHRTILAALEAGISDLLRPVNIRDSYINACGPVDDCSKSLNRSVRPSKRSGYGCSPDLIDAGDSWFELAAEIRQIGVGESLRRLRETKAADGKPGKQL